MKNFTEIYENRQWNKIDEKNFEIFSIGSSFIDAFRSFAL